MAAAVMLVGLVGMIQVVSSCAEMMDLAKKQTIAAQIIQDQIGKVHVADWATVSTYTASASVTIDPSFASSAANFQKFACTRTVVDDPTRANMKKITFTVAWQTGVVGRIRTFSRSGSTYVAKNGLYLTYQRS